ncbi:MAG: type II secretion system F family protein [Planctomycetota bacterium]
MPTFAYTAKKLTGEVIKGVINATDQREATNQLRAQNLLILSLKVKTSGLDLTKFTNIFAPKVSFTELAEFTRQLATMVSAGIPLLESINVLKSQANNPTLKKALEQIELDIRSGSDLSEAMAKHPRIFSKIYISMVKSAEVSGQLDTILSRLASYMEESDSLKREIKSAMTYPVFSLILIIGLTIGLLVFIVPKFESIFTTLKVDLPFITKMLLNISRFILKEWYKGIIGIIVIVIALKIILKNPKALLFKDKMILRIPVFGVLITKSSLARFAKTFETLIHSGVPIVQAMEIVATTCGNIFFEHSINSGREEVKKGENLGDSLQRTGAFPPMVTKMISIGEKSGSLEIMLDKIATFYEQQVRAMVKSLTSLIEPILIMVMGAIVGTIVMAIFIPLLKI